PTAISVMAMVLITCVSAVIAMVLVGRKFSLWATSLLVLLSQGLFHLSLSAMNHRGDLSAMEHAHHQVALSLEISPVAHSETMLYAHVLAALASVVVLHGAERLLKVLAGALSLGSARRILARIRVLVLPAPQSRPYFPLRFALKLAQLGRLPERRGP